MIRSHFWSHTTEGSEHMERGSPSRWAVAEAVPVRHLDVSQMDTFNHFWVLLCTDKSMTGQSTPP